MLTTTKIIRQKLFDGDKERCLKEIFEIENQKIKLIDFYNSPLRDLKKEIDDKSFETIIIESKFKVKKQFH